MRERARVPSHVQQALEIDAVELCAGQAFTCARRSDGQVHCWGNNEAGQLGRGMPGTPSAMPQPVTGLRDVVGIACGAEFACARRRDGTVACWGDNAVGQLGVGMRPYSAEPITLFLQSIVEVAAGGRHACARDGNGQVLCWGDNRRRQIGNDEAAVNTHVPPTRAIITGEVEVLALGGAFSCAGLHDTTVVCWGDNASAQTGQAGGTEIVQPTPVPMLQFSEEIALGAAHGCARRVDSFGCWGANTAGQAGQRNVGMSSATVQPVMLPE